MSTMMGVRDSPPQASRWTLTKIQVQKPEPLFAGTVQDILTEKGGFSASFERRYYDVIV